MDYIFLNITPAQYYIIVCKALMPDERFTILKKLNRTHRCSHILYSQCLYGIKTAGTCIAIKTETARYGDFEIQFSHRYLWFPLKKTATCEKNNL